MPHRTCDADGCERKHVARGLCLMHWKREHGKPTRYARTCDTCATDYLSSRPDGRFCDDDCKGLWYSEDTTRPTPQRRISRLPTDHPVRVLIRERATALTPMRAAFEANDWPALLTLIESMAVKVDDCWLWPRGDKQGYGRIAIAKRTFGAHRLSKSASLGYLVPSHQPVHHVCAEPLCVRPTHLQVVTPQENTAEMLERRYYKQRIAELEAALRTVCPAHPLIALAISPAA